MAESRPNDIKVAQKVAQVALSEINFAQRIGTKVAQPAYSEPIGSL